VSGEIVRKEWDFMTDDTTSVPQRQKEQCKLDCRHSLFDDYPNASETGRK
jgi:hypothetical protein